jgi:hypothetical protein
MCAFVYDAVGNMFVSLCFILYYTLIQWEEDMIECTPVPWLMSVIVFSSDQLLTFGLNSSNVRCWLIFNYKFTDWALTLGVAHISWLWTHSGVSSSAAALTNAWLSFRLTGVRCSHSLPYLGFKLGLKIFWVSYVVLIDTWWWTLVAMKNDMFTFRM